MKTYSVKSDNGRFWVVTHDKFGHEFDVTTSTRSRPQAEQWCTALRRAAQVNAERRAVAMDRAECYASCRG